MEIVHIALEQVGTINKPFIFGLAGNYNATVSRQLHDFQCFILGVKELPAYYSERKRNLESA